MAAILENLAADQFYTITESSQSDPGSAPNSSTPPLFHRSALFTSVRHEQDPGKDFRAQPLLPWDLSHLGPGIACGDVDGDGRVDFYLSGSPNQPGALLLSSHGFQPANLGAPPGASQELASLFFDADGNGTLDLYVAAAPAAPRTNALAADSDRLYLNDGRGHFTAAPAGTLPEDRFSGGIVVAADFDRDDDLDLFVGGRFVPGQYPLTPRSRLLRNDHGKFTDVTDQLAPRLAQAGLVTSAIWSDVDDDGWPDLLVTTEWGPVRLFRNNHGRLEDRTREAGLAERSGWWSSITAGDVNNDGAIDYVVGNFGLNTRYQPAADRPVALFYAEFEPGTAPQILEAEYTGDRWLPVRGKSDLEKVLPSLTAKFASHHAFAAATLPDLVSPRILNQAFHV